MALIYLSRFIVNLSHTPYCVVNESKGDAAMYVSKTRTLNEIYKTKEQKILTIYILKQFSSDIAFSAFRWYANSAPNLMYAVVHNPPAPLLSLGWRCSLWNNSIHCWHIGSETKCCNCHGRKSKSSFKNHYSFVYKMCMCVSGLNR